MTRRMLLVATLVLSAACAGREEGKQPIGETEGPKINLAARVQLDSGNAAFRARDYEAARRYYRAATEAAPDNSATWFGLSMAEQKLGNAEAAKAAADKAQQLSPGLKTHPTDMLQNAHPGDATPNPHVKAQEQKKP